MSVSHEKLAYHGLDRRSSCDRRSGGERRNLLRFEALGSERRERMLRRREDKLWLESHKAVRDDGADKQD